MYLLPDLKAAKPQQGVGDASKHTWCGVDVETPCGATLCQNTKALCFLSAKDILHRDFKPDNIMIDNSHKVNVIDFGSSAPHYESKKF